ncbi:DMT family transporter [Olsenella massiliensis]|uniref:DMT family transporter n=1 Tax=Olsenella massiliensis TaxID=1622075 RepID=UPI00071CB88A|nr:EamA family transporter [Olsenella massiliensis]
MATRFDGRRMLRGTLMVLAGGTCWGLNGTLSGLLMSRYGVSPLWLVCVRQLTACWLFLALAHLRTPGKVGEVLHSGRELLAILSVAVCSILFSQVAYMQAINASNSATATVLQNLGVLLTMFYVCLVNRRLPRRREALGAALAFGGTFLLATGGNPGSLHLPLGGLLWGLACALAATFLAVQPLRLIGRWGNFTVNGLAFLMSGILLCPVVRPWEGMPDLDLVGWAIVAFSMLFGTFGAYSLYLGGVNRVGSVRGVMLGTSEPVVATLSTVLIVGTQFLPTDFVGFAMIILMVFLTA